MRIQISQQTSYRYAGPANYSMQVLRVRPRDNGGQKVLFWSLSAPHFANVMQGEDAFGNLLDTLYVSSLHSEIALTISAEVETADTGGVLLGAHEPFEPSFFLRETPLTAPDAAIEALSASAVADSDGSPLDLAHRLMDKVRDAIDYRIGETHAETTAAEAVAHGRTMPMSSSPRRAMRGSPRAMSAAICGIPATPNMRLAMHGPKPILMGLAGSDSMSQTASARRMPMSVSPAASTIWRPLRREGSGAAAARKRWKCVSGSMPAPHSSELAGAGW